MSKVSVELVEVDALDLEAPPIWQHVHALVRSSAYLRWHYPKCLEFPPGSGCHECFCYQAIDLDGTDPPIKEDTGDPGDTDGSDTGESIGRR